MTVKRRDELEKLTPALRRFAHALTAGEQATTNSQSLGLADLLVHNALQRGLDLQMGRWPNGLRLFLYGSIVAANRQRLQGEANSHAPNSGVVNDHAAPHAIASAAISHSVRSNLPIVAAVQSLPLQEREALLLTGLEHLTHSETCEVLRITQPELLTCLVHARQRISAQMGTALRLARASRDGANHDASTHRVSSGTTSRHLRVVK